MYNKWLLVNCEIASTEVNNVGKMCSKNDGTEQNGTLTVTRVLIQVRSWQWKPFKNSARSDNLSLLHWKRCDDVSTDYPFAKYSVKREVRFSSFRSVDIRFGRFHRVT